ncbi:MAG: putative Ser/Thr protein kinase [Kiritimatiellia bacterium]|jgi:predicted Ser/Thr protein kinase
MLPGQIDAVSRTFHMDECIGVGGFGEVYRATMVSPGGLERQVAVKTLNPRVGPDSEPVLRLRDEAKVLALVEHRCILGIIDMVMLHGRVAIVMQYLDGQDLDDCLKGDKPMGPRAAVEAVGEVASALASAWNSLKIIHRDIKPSNIRVTSSGEVKLMDFGLAKSDEVEREGKTGTGLVVGSYGYIAPERVTRASEGPPVDVFALGCALFEMLNGGSKLYHGVEQMPFMRMALDDEEHEVFIDEMMADLPELPEELVVLLRSMLRWEPEERPNASVLEERLEHIAGEMAGSSLRRFARERDWPTVATVKGELKGLKLEESTLFLATQDLTQSAGLPLMTQAAPVSMPASRMPMILAIVAIVGLLAVLLVVGVAGASVGGAMWLGTSLQEADPVVAAPASTSAAPASAAPSPGVAAAPVDAPVDTAPGIEEVSAEGTADNAKPGDMSAGSAASSRSTAGNPVHAAGSSVVAEPHAPAVVEAPEPIPPATGTLVVQGKVPVRLTSGAKSLGAGPVPVGSYSVQSNFGPGFRGVGDVSVVEGGTVTVKCSKMLMNCEISSAP